jgi:hypothetical protein
LTLSAAPGEYLSVLDKPALPLLPLLTLIWLP